MPTIKRLADNAPISVAAYPTWNRGIWECGDQRFTDPDQSLYVAVGYPACVVNPGRLYNLFGLQTQMDAEAANADPRVKQVLTALIRAGTFGESIDLASSPVQGALALMSAVAVPGSSPSRTYIQASEIARISTNKLP